MNPQTNSGPVAEQKSGGRQPLLWAALAFAAGIATGVHAWRPPLWWVVAWMVFTLSGAYLLRRRGRSAFIAGLGALFFLGALMVQVRGLDNAGNPGAFDYRGYLADHGIVALASTKAASVEVLPGFAGSRAELWRSRIHRSVIDEVHALWPPHQAALMDAMVIGEDAFINRPTRADFQRSGTYHVLVVSGME